MSSVAAAWAKAQLAYALSGNGGCGEVDSIATAMDTGRTELAASDRGMVAYAQAACRRDRPAMLAASKAVLQAAPQSIGFTVLGGIDAIELARPREGLAILQRFDPDRIPLSDQQASIYWGFLAYAEHDLAMIQQDSNGGRIPAGSVLAPLADSAAVRRGIESQLQHPDPSELAGDQCAVLELAPMGLPPPRRRRTPPVSGTSTVRPTTRGGWRRRGRRTRSGWRRTWLT